MNNDSVSRLRNFLLKANGLVAFESALIVRPVTTTEAAESIETWNRFDNRKGPYENTAIHVKRLVDVVAYAKSKNIPLPTTKLKTVLFFFGIRDK